jgi:short-chain fatty acids transporter
VDQPDPAFLGAAVLAIAGLQAKDFMGYCAVHLLLTGIIIAIGLTFL